MDPLALLGVPALWAIAVAFFSPLAIAVVVQAHWSPRTKSVAAFVFYFAVAAVTAAVAGEFTATNIIHFLLLVFVMASASYQHLWHPTGVAPAIEAATGAAPPASLVTGQTATEPAAPAATPVPEAPVAEVAAAQEPATIEAPAAEPPAEAPATFDAPPVIAAEPINTDVPAKDDAAPDAPEVVNAPVS